jgi:hypothetical protein
MGLRKIVFLLTTFLFLIYQLICSTLLAGDSTRFEIPGKVSAKIFSNFHTYINTGDNALAFEITRAYFGYENRFSKHFEAAVKLDIGSPEDLSEYSRIRRYAYFKNAYLKFTYEKITSYFGIIDLLHFKLQENFWAHRYIEKSFNDRYRFGNTADIGWLVIYDWKKWLSFDFTIMNGEGYTNLQNDNTLKAGAGVTINFWSYLTTRVYYDYTSKSTDQSTLATFVGYQKKGKYSAGIEYNYRFNDNLKEGYDKYGYSIYGSYNIFEKLQVFGRFDKLNSNKPDEADIPWNLAEDGSSIIGGIEYTPVKNVKIAADYQDWFPWAENRDNKQLIYLNLEITF